MEIGLTGWRPDMTVGSIHIIMHIDRYGVRRHGRPMERIDKMLLDLRGPLDVGFVVGARAVWA
jgi:hypothetical protein